MKLDLVRAPLESLVRVRFLFVVMALVVALSTQTAIAQAQSRLGQRRIISKIVPAYPEIAKRYRIKGIVKLEVIVRKDGSVRSAKVLGGSPVLIGSATDAVSSWKFELAPAESTEVVQVAFDD